jgi:hypothetical protein
MSSSDCLGYYFWPTGLERGRRSQKARGLPREFELHGVASLFMVRNSEVLFAVVSFFSSTGVVLEASVGNQNTIT